MSVSYKKYIILLVIIYAVIYSIQLGKAVTASTMNISSTGSKKSTKSTIDWNESKCYPHMIFLAGFFEDADGDSFISKIVNNFDTCIFSYVENFVKKYASPLLFIVTFIKDGIGSVGKIIDSFRKMSMFLREMFMALVESVTDRMKNSFAAILYLQEKMKLIIKKQSAMMEVLNQLVSTLPFMLHAFYNGPIVRFGAWMTSFFGLTIAFVIICIVCIFVAPGIVLFGVPIMAALCPICTMCFTGDTKIDLENNKSKPIKDIIIGENIKNNKVVGKIYMKPHYADTYNYNDVTVTGSHLVFDKKWYRVEDNNNATPNHMVTDLYCLITDNNTIYSNGIKFRDYQETKDKDINLKINYLIAGSLNNEEGCIKTEEDHYHTYYWGFHKNTEVLIDNKYTQISEIVANPQNYDIQGVVEIHSPYVLYDYDGVFVSGNTIVYEEGIWLRVHQSIKSRRLSDEKILYNIITDDNIIITRGTQCNVIFRDFSETNDEKVNNVIDKLVEDRLNLIFDFDK